MRDLRYWYSPGGFKYRRDGMDYVGLGVGTLLSPLWGPFYLLGRAVAWLSVRVTKGAK